MPLCQVASQVPENIKEIISSHPIAIRIAHSCARCPCAFKCNVFKTAKQALSKKNFSLYDIEELAELIGEEATEKLNSCNFD